jgi:hypothetical protein
VQPLVFSSVLACERRDELESLLFFHPHQGEHSTRINDSIKHYGFPRIADDGTTLRVAIDGLEVQTLYALIERGIDRILAGVVVYSRLEEQALTLLHIAVRPEFCYNGGYKNELLLVRILAQVRSIARRIKGVHRIAIAYSERSPNVDRRAGRQSRRDELPG